jgi:S1-C subfamily serine protease
VSGAAGAKGLAMYPHEPYPPRARRSISGPLVLLILLTAIGAFAVARLVSGPGRVPAPEGGRVVTPRGELTLGEQTLIELFKKSSPSVVHVSTDKVVRSLWRTQQQARGTGTGFVWDARGHIVTNFHVVQGGERWMVGFKGEEANYEATVRGAEPAYDIAVLLVEADKDKLVPIDVGASHDLQVGQSVLAIGNPFGLDHTLTSGIVSALGRSVIGVGGNPIDDMIQTDAAINPGNSGGPLLDSAGRLIGMNTAIRSDVGQSSGIGFAVPADTINWVVRQIIEFGKIVRPSLGAVLLNQPEVEAVYVSEVEPGGPAHSAGLRGEEEVRYGVVRRGDFITKFDEVRVTSKYAIDRILEQKKAGDTVKVEYVRGRSRLTATLRLGPPQTR